jgi:hypothetical protein
MKEKVHVAHGDGQDVDWIWGMAVLEARVEAFVVLVALKATMASIY